MDSASPLLAADCTNTVAVASLVDGVCNSSLLVETESVRLIKQ